MTSHPNDTIAHQPLLRAKSRYMTSKSPHVITKLSMAYHITLHHISSYENISDVSFSSQAMIKVPSRPWIRPEACMRPYPSSKLSVQKFSLPCATETADTDAPKHSSFLSISCHWSVKPCASERGGLDASRADCAHF